MGTTRQSATASAKKKAGGTLMPPTNSTPTGGIEPGMCVYAPYHASLAGTVRQVRPNGPFEANGDAAAWHKPQGKNQLPIGESQATFPLVDVVRDLLSETQKFSIKNHGIALGGPPNSLLAGWGA
jgi:hypothetical protein